MKTYKVIWEVSKIAFVKAENEAEAIDKVMACGVEAEENEITASPEAFEIAGIA